jgi:hypothetical protein
LSIALVNRLLDHIDRLPDDVAGWLRDGFAAWQAGADLHEALDLPGPDTGRRDDLLRTIIALSPGESSTARCAFVVGCLGGSERHPRPDMQHLIESLRLVGCPRSIRQLKRIVQGRRQDSWRLREADMIGDLCPIELVSLNSGINLKTGS